MSNFLADVMLAYTTYKRNNTVDIEIFLQCFLLGFLDVFFYIGYTPSVGKPKTEQKISGMCT